MNERITQVGYLEMIMIMLGNHPSDLNHLSIVSNPRMLLLFQRIAFLGLPFLAISSSKVRNQIQSRVVNRCQSVLQVQSRVINRRQSVLHTVPEAIWSFGH